MHLPELPLLASAAAGLGGFEGVLVDRFQGKVAKDIFDLPSADIVLLDLGHRLTDVPRAEGSLEIGEFDEG